MITGYENICTIAFVYCVPSSIINDDYGKIIDLSIQCNNDAKYYDLIGMSEYPLIRVCTPPEILYDDMIRFPESYLIWEEYKTLVNQYGQDVVDRFIMKDESLVKEKILNTLIFAMDTMYKSDNIVIEFTRSVDTQVNGMSYLETYGMTNLLYSVIQENFTIIDQNLIDKINYVYIRKRSE